MGILGSALIMGEPRLLVGYCLEQSSIIFSMGYIFGEEQSELQNNLKETSKSIYNFQNLMHKFFDGKKPGKKKAQIIAGYLESSELLYSSMLFFKTSVSIP